LPYFRIGPSPKALGEFCAYLYFHGGLGQLQGLGVSIHRYEFDPFQAGGDHSVDGIVASAPYPNYLYAGKLVKVELKINHYYNPPLK